MKSLFCEVHHSQWFLIKNDQSTNYKYSEPKQYTKSLDDSQILGSRYYLMFPY